jgi:tetratricopeptide (TPR) repeat protein
VGIAAVLSAMAGVFGNHLPWPASFDRHPYWITGVFALLTLVLVFVAVALFLREPTHAAGVPQVFATAPGAMALSGDGSAMAGPGGIAVASGGVLLVPPSPERADPMPPPHVGLCLGRDQEIAAVVAVWTAGRSVVVLGGPGIGKSTVLGRSLNEAAVVAAYGSRRFVVSCDGVESARLVYDKLASVVGVSLGDHLPNRVVSFLLTEPCVLVLDNFESVTDGDPQGAAALLATLRAGPRPVALGLGCRGRSMPPGLAEATSVVLGPLGLSDASRVFHALAGSKHGSDPDSARLVADVDGVPLALVLLGRLASTESGLGTLVAAWERKRTELLQQGVQPDRTSSVPVSIELSWDTLSPGARAALSLAALLPDGWPEGHCTLYLPDELAPGVLELSGRALLHDEYGRQRCLAPVRQHVYRSHPPGRDDFGRLLAGVRGHVQSAGSVGGQGGAVVARELAPEFTNLVEVLRAGLAVDKDTAAVVPDLLWFQVFTGLGDDQLALRSLAAAEGPQVLASNARALGQLYYARGRNGQARELFNQALPLYRRVGAVLGEANSLSSLGELEFLESRNDQARELFNQALPLYRRVGAVLGEANSLSSLGELEFLESRNDQARELFNQALPLYQDIRDRYSQAVTHAWLARTTTGRHRAGHCSRLDSLAQELNLPGFRDALRSIAAC